MAVCIAAFFINPVLAVAVFCLSIWLVAVCARWEIRRRTIHLHYTSHEDVWPFFQRVISAANLIASCSGVWCPKSSTLTTTLTDFKQNVGATEAVERAAASVGQGTPPWVKSDVPIPAIRLPGRTLYLLPNGIVVYDSSGIAHVAYNELTTSTKSVRFVERVAPADATILEHTWEHPNKDGGPDRRFSSNAQMPVCQYGEILLYARGGLLAHLQTSKYAAVEEFAKAIEAIQDAAVQFTRDQASDSLDPWIEVNSERMQSVGEAAASAFKQPGALIMTPIGAIDRLIGSIAGEGNDLVYNFLRIVAVAFLTGVAGLLAYFLLNTR